ncbi:MAG: alpha/beta fold hydrolase [Phycisphaerales bacterium]|nr:MAG: alpha/beta fold hydrolase [Phycisphaerales bacterium]
MSTKLHLSCLAIALLWSAATTAQVEQPAGEVLAYDHDHPAVGTWVGRSTTSEGATPFVMLEVKRGEEGDYSVLITALAGGLLDTGCADIEATDFDFAFTIPGINVRFTGTISEDGQAYAGTVAEVGGEEPDDEPGTFDLRRTLMPGDLPEQLAFSGELRVQMMTIPMTIVLARTPGGNWVGHLDVPMQMLREFPFISFKQDEDDTITADLPVPGAASIEVRIDELEKRLTGTFFQAGLEMEIDFTRDVNYAYAELNRPQNPEPPYPYEEREITAPHAEGFSLGGTLTIPNSEEFGEGPFPAAVLISGSGAQDRNESLLGHRPFLVIADYLARHGIAVMRYDDRGVGASRVDDMSLVTQATSADFATDTAAVVEKLKSVPEIDPDRIGLIGHSEGGLIAPMVGQMRGDIAFMVLLAGPGTVGTDLLLKQSELFLRAAGRDEAAIAMQDTIRRELYTLIAEGGCEDRVEELVRRLVEAEFAAAGATPTEEQMEQGVNGAKQTLTLPWMRFFFRYDPVPALKETTCPVLAMNGTLDLQVWHEQNLDAIERVMKEAGRDITAIRYENRNHLFQPTETGAFSEYVQIETTFDEAVMADMVNWIQEKVGE